MRNSSKKERTPRGKGPARLELSSVRTERTNEALAPFFTHSPDLLCVAGLDGYFKRLNPAWKRVLGWTLAELRGAPFVEFVHPDDRPVTLAAVARLAGGAPVISFENRYRRKNGEYRWLQWNARPLPDRRLIYAIARDRTDQRFMEREILDIGDREKEHLGREMHDGLCQTLAGIAALSTALARKLAARAHPGAVEAAEITALLNQTGGHVRDLARGLNPVGLDQIGLVAALEGYAANVRALFRVSCRFRCAGPFPRLGPEVEMQFYRIAQEAVNNAITHAHGSHIEIGLRFRHRTGVLSIRDDGAGISKRTLAGPGIGLHTMDYRSRMIDANLKVQRRARRGTEVICAFRLPPDAAKERGHGRKKN